MTSERAWDWLGETAVLGDGPPDGGPRHGGGRGRNGAGLARRACRRADLRERGPPARRLRERASRCAGARSAARWLRPRTSWDGLWSGAFGAWTDYGTSAMRSVSGWVVGTAPSPERGQGPKMRAVCLTCRTRSSGTSTPWFAPRAMSCKVIASASTARPRSNWRSSSSATLSERERTDLRHGSSTSRAAWSIPSAATSFWLARRQPVCRRTAPAVGYRLAGVIGAAAHTARRAHPVPAASSLRTPGLVSKGLRPLVGW